MISATPDDVYDDPDNILADDDEVKMSPDGGALADDRGPIDELEVADGGEAHDELNPRFPEDSDPDSFHLGDVEPADENDGTES